MARRPLLVGASVIAALAALVLLVAAVLWTVQRGAVLPNTTVAGVDVGGMDGDEVRSALEPTATARETDPVTFTFEGGTETVTPADVGFGVDLDATVADALARGRRGLPGDVFVRIRSLWSTEELPLRTSTDETAASAWVDEVAERIDRDRSPGVVEADPETLEVRVELPHGAAAVRRDEATAALTEAMLRPGPQELPLPVDTTPQPVPDADVERVAEQLRTAIAEPLTVTAGDNSLTVEPATIARLVEVVEVPTGSDGGGDAADTAAPTSADADADADQGGEDAEASEAGQATVELRVTAERLEDVLGATTTRFDVDPQDAGYETSRTPPTSFDHQGSTSFSPVAAEVGVQPARPGTRFDPDRAAEQLTELLRDGAHEAELDVEMIDADLTTEQAEAWRPTHLLGTFTTYYQPATRARNIQRLADVVDDTLLLPGEQFSINGISGERTCAKGYAPAGTIVRGELVDTCGGGVSQFGTTTFNAAFFAGVQLDQWKAHSWYISRYPMGREATLSYPELDVKFTNTTDGAIVVRASHTARSVTVSLYGRPIADTVRAQHGNPTNPTSAQTRTRTASDLACGETRQVQGASDGFTVEVVRTVELRGGGTDTRTIRTVYSPQHRIVEQGAC